MALPRGFVGWDTNICPISNGALYSRDGWRDCRTGRKFPGALWNALSIMGIRDIIANFYVYDTVGKRQVQYILPLDQYEVELGIKYEEARAALAEYLMQAIVEGPRGKKEPQATADRRP